MKNENVDPDDLKWRCHDCGGELVVGEVAVTYMNNRFTADLPHCSHCKTVLITEALAMGKMAEVERILEDK